ncbi:MAG: class I poly(R)-hydroxyalkanoic acid synthase [Legionellales bacterium]|nr:class I poly(R)-hydroxyalkanoic acid synthase [Legionellales bacterium]
MEPSAENGFNELMKNGSEIAEKTYQVLNQFMSRWQEGQMGVGWNDFAVLGKLYQDYLQNLWSDPNKLFAQQMAYWQSMMGLWQNMTLAWLGEKVEPVIQPSVTDKRFRDTQWDNIPLFAFIKQAYLIFAQHAQESVAKVQGLDAKRKNQLAFFTQQFVNAMSPSNFILTNPQVLNATLHSKGENLVNGLNNMLEDLAKNTQGAFTISMTDMQAFSIGKNIATTSGSVVWQNDLLQLIQYHPTSKEVYQKPLLIIPPWINKYYILDLQPENSLVKYLVDQGFTVFMISWVNPTEHHRDKDFASYLAEGSLAAIQQIIKLCDEKTINVVGYCIGGTLLSATLAHLAVKKQQWVNSATYFATMIDFSEPGDLGVFIDEEQIQQLEKLMSEKGFLPGAAMATSFNMLRSNELIWSYYINNYLMGNEPFPFDLLYWNCDNTNLPAKMHSFYLRKMYLENVFCQPNGVTLLDTPLDIQKITVPAMFISAEGDHIAPWKSTYLGALLHQGETEFVLSSSGHIAGIVNPPVKKKYAHWINKTLPSDSMEWFSKAKECEGSWWPYWVKWLSKQSGDKIPARKIGCGKVTELEPAPGSYVKAVAKRVE